MGKFRKVYALAPAEKVTGGVELVHQLVDELIGLGQEAYVVYILDGEITKDGSVPDAYRKYRLATADSIEDSVDNMLVLPEIYFDFIYRFTSIRIGCWWMSVDNHYYSACLKDMLGFYGRWKDKAYTLYRYLKGEIRFRNSHDDLKRQSERIIHFYQSVYAQNHLYRTGFETVLPLSDYVHPDLFVIGGGIKEDIILYNPKKGEKYVRRLMGCLPDCTFIPLQGMTREELNQVFDRAKIYVDFGAFPGKDRIPREAVLHGCCLITGRFGASAFYEDVPIPGAYKFDLEKGRPWADIVRLVRDIFANYDSHAGRFAWMRSRIGLERETFRRETAAIFM